MNRGKRNTVCRGLLRAGAWGAFAVVVIWVAGLSVEAAEVVRTDKVSIRWDTTVSLGAQWRVQDRDPELIGLTNGGQAFSVNGDDGNLNFGTGAVSLVPKVTSEVDMRFGDNFGVFVRGWAFYDWIASEEERERTPLTDAALDRVGRRLEFLDYYARFGFRLGNKPAELRVGNQVVNWGENTFIQGGLNVINPIDVLALRNPGAELREALFPIELVWGNFTLTQATSLELFYQLNWEETIIDPPGTYFSTNDFVGRGGDTVFLGFGDAPDIPQAPFAQDIADPTRPILGVGTSGQRDASDSGQYGGVFRFFVDKLGGTEFGLYYANYHSRLPVISGTTGTLAGAQQAAITGAATPTIATETMNFLMMNPGNIPGAVQAGTAAGVQAGASAGASAAIATAAAVAPTAVPTVSQIWATDAYSQTARYYTEYPEDIQIYGFSFNAQLGTSGVALQGEASYREDVPLQVDDVELLFAALAPISPVFNGTSGLPGEPGASQLISYRGQDLSTAFATDIPGFIRTSQEQYQVTMTKIFGSEMFADQTVLVAEVGYNRSDIPDKEDLRMEGPATYTSGNPFHASFAPTNPATGLPLGAHPGKPAEPGEFFADRNSWGYRVALRQTYNRAIGAWNMTPSLAWSHDVAGNTPGPGGSFLEGRQAISVALGFDFQANLEAQVRYTSFFGAGRHNLLNDRDFASAYVRYSF